MSRTFGVVAAAPNAAGATRQPTTRAQSRIVRFRIDTRAEFTRLRGHDTVAGVSQVENSSNRSAESQLEIGSDRVADAVAMRTLEAREPLKSSLLKSIVRVLIVVAVAYFVWRFIDRIGWDELIRKIGQARKPYVALALGCLAARFGLIYYRWSVVLDFAGLHLSRFIVWTSLMTGVLLNHVTPTARVLGGIVRARGLSKIYQTPFSRIYATILVEQLGNQLVQTTLMWIAIVPFAWTLGWQRAAVAIAVFPAALLTLSIAWWRLRTPSARRWQWTSFFTRRAKTHLHKLGPIASGGRTIAETFRAAFGDVGLQLKLAVCGVGIVISNALALWLVLLSLSTEIGFLYVFAIVSLGLAAGMLTGTPGGFATTEAAMIALLVAVDVPEIDAAAGVLLYRAMHYAIVLVVGSICAVIFETTVARRSRSRGELAAKAHPGSESPESESH